MLQGIVNHILIFNPRALTIRKIDEYYTLLIIETNYF